MLALLFFRIAGCGHGPNGFHLLAGDGFHVFIVKDMFALLILGGPENGFGAVGEVPATQVGRRVGLFPGDVVENLEPELLHRVADAEDDVVRAADPDGAVGLEDALAASQPFGVEFVIEFGAAAFIPVAFVYFDHFAGVATDAAVGEEIGRVGKDAIEAAFGVFSGNGIEEFEAVAVIEPDAVGLIVMNELGRGRWYGL